MSLRELCNRLGGKFRKRKYDEEEFEVCRIPIEAETPYQKRMEVHRIFNEIAKFAESELGLTNLSLGSTINLSKAGASYSAHIDGTLTAEEPKDVTAIEIEFNPKEEVYLVTPITKRGRGCTLFFSKYKIGGYCDKNKTYISVEGSIFY